MNLLIYAHNTDRAAQRLRRQIDFYTAKRPAENMDSIERLEKWCRRYFADREATVAVLFAANRQELARLNAIRDLLHGLRIILVLPDDSPEAVSAGHRLRPRYISYAEGTLKDVAAVIRKMTAAVSGSSGNGKSAVTEVA